MRNSSKGPIPRVTMECHEIVVNEALFESQKPPRYVEDFYGSILWV
jgi:hypothetical protein